MTKRNLEQRLILLDNINKFSNDTEKEMTFILQSLGWNRDDLRNKISTRSKCPQNRSHLVSSSNMQNHLEKCNAGFNCTDELFPINCNNNPRTTVTIDKKLSAHIIAEAAKKDLNFKRGVPIHEIDNRLVPSSLNQMLMTFTNDERRALYDYTVSLAPAMENVLNNPACPQYSEEKVYDATKGSLEELAMLRDMKRRRTKYKVSTKAKSYTEIMREVVNNLMASHVEEINEDYATDQHKFSVKRKRY